MLLRGDAHGLGNYRPALTPCRGGAGRAWVP